MRYSGNLNARKNPMAVSRCNKSHYRCSNAAPPRRNKYIIMQPAFSAAALAVLVAVAAATITRTAAKAPDFDLLRVKHKESLDIPLRAVGQLSNGCTGWLIGPCHVMTVGHCVYEPWKKIWWRGLDFHPGRNQGEQAAGDSPLGSASKADVRLHPNWTSSAAGPASDAALIITSSPIGKQVGWFRHRQPSWVTQPPQQQQQGQEQQGLGQQVSAQQLTLHIVGYPDNKANGSMWQQCCNALDWQLQGSRLWHDCYARGGNSGSPVWVVWPTGAAGQASSSAHHQASNLSWDQVQAVGVHTSSLQVLRDSQMGVYAQELYAQSIASAQQRQQAAAVGQVSAQCTAGTSSFTVATPTTAAGSIERARAAVGTAAARRGSTESVAGSATAGSTQQGSTSVGQGVADKAAAAAAGPMTTGGRALLAGAGGREEDEEHTLLPVAVHVPFTGDTLAWVDAVLKEFARSPGE